MRHTRFLGAALVALAACKGAQTKTPVVTTTDNGQSVSPSGDAADRRGTSLARFVNAVPGSSKMTVKADSTALFGDVAYKTVTSYQEVQDNLERFTVQGGNAERAELAGNSEMLADGHRYTIVALRDEQGGAKLRILRDELVPDAGKARIRVIQGAPGLPEVDVAVQGQKDPIFEGVNYASEAGFKDVTPGRTVLEVREEDKSAALKRLPAMSLEVGKSYTIVLTGTAGRLEAITFEDAPEGKDVSLLGGD